MKPHTPDQVAAMKSFADSQPSGAERKTYALNGLEVTYTTVDMGTAKPFDYAVAAFVAPREDSEPITEAYYEIAVSDDVPEELQGVWAWHELHDFAVLGHEAENRCLQSEQVIVERMSSDPELYQRYLAVRIQFYDGLAVFIATDLDQKGDGSVYSSSDLQGCYDAIAFLQKKMNELQETDETTSSSILDLAKAKRTHLSARAKQEAARAAQKAEEERVAAEKKAEADAILKEESDKNVKEFIEVMRSHRIATKQLYLQKLTLLKKERGNYDYEGGYDYTYWYDVHTTKIGDGWVVVDASPNSLSPKGIIVLESGEAYQYDTSFVDPKEYHHGSSYIYEHFTGDTPNENSLKAHTNADDSSTLDAPFAGHGVSTLVDAIIKYGADKPKPKKNTTEPEPSPTAWVGRPHTG